IRCFGWDIVPAHGDGLQATGRVGGAPIVIDSVHATLRTIHDKAVDDSSRGADLGVVTCPRREPLTVDTLLRVASGRPAAVRVVFDTGTVILVADGGLFADIRLRDTDAGPFALSLIVPEYQRFVVDEIHHGYGAGGSMTKALLEWSTSSPWGAFFWQAL